MTTITIPNVEDALRARLSEQAARHGRSLEEEACDILRAAVAHEQPTVADLAAAIRARFAPLGGIELPESMREEIRDPPGFEQ